MAGYVGGPMVGLANDLGNFTIGNAMQAINAGQEWYPLGQLGQTIVTAQPDFDPRSYGCAKLSDLIMKTGRYESRKTANQIEIRRVD